MYLLGYFIISIVIFIKYENKELFYNFWDRGNKFVWFELLGKLDVVGDEKFE